MKSSYTIPLFDLKANYKSMRKEIDEAIKRVLIKGVFILGEEVHLFEKEFASYLGVHFGVGLASGTDALILALKALGVKGGDEVILPANSYPTAFAVAASGATIKLVDVDSETLLIDPSRIELSITANTRAIVPVHLYGRSCDMDAIMHIAKKHRLFVVEDAAQAHGAEYEGRKVGSIGNVGCFSFYPTKNLGALGDAGIVVTNNTRIAERVCALRMYGEKVRFESHSIGVNSRLDELQAAILRVKLRRLDAQNRIRRKIALLYRENLKDTDIMLPQEGKSGSHVWHLFVIRTEKRDILKQRLLDNGIETGIHFPIPTHLVPAFKNLGYKKGDFPVSEKAANEILSLPCYPQLPPAHVLTICNLIRDFLR